MNDRMRRGLLPPAGAAADAGAGDPRLWAGDAGCAGGGAGLHGGDTAAKRQADGGRLRQRLGGHRREPGRYGGGYLRLPQGTGALCDPDVPGAGGLGPLASHGVAAHRPDGAGAGSGPHRLRPGQERSGGEPAGRRRISIHRRQISGNAGTQRLDLRPDRSGQLPLRRAGGCRLHQSHYFAGAGGSAGAGGRLRPDGRELGRGSDSHDPAGAGALSEQHSDVYRRCRGVCDHPGGGAPGAGVAV